MNLLLKRIYKGDSYTIGKLYIDNEYFCDTLEDTVRTLPSTCPGGNKCECKEKVYGQTAIPKGIYKIVLSYSPKFKRILPLLIDVPHFSGIRIHSGNTDKDTEGCILVGTNDVKGQVRRSKEQERRLIERLEDEGEIYITIE